MMTRNINTVSHTYTSLTIKAATKILLSIQLMMSHVYDYMTIQSNNIIVKILELVMFVLLEIYKIDLFINLYYKKDFYFVLGSYEREKKGGWKKRSHKKKQWVKKEPA